MHLKTWKNCPQKLLIIGPNFFFSIANQPKTSPNHIFCFIKMSPCATSIQWLCSCLPSSLSCRRLCSALPSNLSQAFDFALVSYIYAQCIFTKSCLETTLNVWMTIWMLLDHDMCHIVVERNQWFKKERQMIATEKFY